MIGKIHSFESFATLDGGGIRFAVFLQGCPLRCVYCHNADSQGYESDILMTAQEVASKIAKLKHYYINGGVTVSGGEPLAQKDFLLELIKEVKLLGLHVAIDTSLALLPDNFDEIVKLADLFIVDLKFWNEESYVKYCGGNLRVVLDGISRIEQGGKNILLRTVVVPTINDTNWHMDRYYKLIQDFGNIQKYELLAYHTMGAYKYNEIGRVYPLEGIPAMDNALLDSFQHYINKLMKAK